VDRSPVDALLPALLADEPDEQAVSDALLDRLDVSRHLDELIEGLARLLAAATSPQTRLAYESDFAQFTGWADEYGLDALPALPQTVALYISAHQDRWRPTTMVRRLSAIAVRHRVAGYPSPTDHELVRRAVAGLRRTRGTRPAAKAALVTAQLSIICAELLKQTQPRTPARQPRTPPRQPRTSPTQRPTQARQRRAPDTASLAPPGDALRATRDRALLLIGYAAALRRSEIVALDLADLVEDDTGLRVLIRASKTDQLRHGEVVGIAHGHPANTCAATCPIRAWREWRAALARAVGTDVATGADELPPDSPAFRPVTRHGAIGTPANCDVNARLTGQSIALIVKRAVALLGDEQRFPVANYAGHSLRAGFATQAAAAGVPLERIMRQTRHRSVAVALRYIRDADVWTSNPSAALGL
jgi:integrase